VRALLRCRYKILKHREEMFSNQALDIIPIREAFDKVGRDGSGQIDHEEFVSLFLFF
jgi:Ca2+-binding EF-hand superfamily protein